MSRLAYWQQRHDFLNHFAAANQYLLYLTARPVCRGWLHVALPCALRRIRGIQPVHCINLTNPLTMKFNLRTMKQNSLKQCWPLLLAGLLAVNLPISQIICPSAQAADEVQKLEVLNNASIIELQELNLGDGVILDKIKTSQCDFDVTVSGLKQLKAAKVSDAVIQAMIRGKSTVAATASAPAVEQVKPMATGDLNDPLVQHDSGVWLCEEVGGAKKMTPLNADSYRIWNSMSGPFATAERAVLSGLAAKAQTTSRRPVFYMYFGEGAQNNSGMMGMTTPDQVPLAILDLKPKTQERLLVIGSGGTFSGYNSGVRTKSLRAFSSEKVAAGIYKITLPEDLVTGEYAFCYYPAQIQLGTAGRMFCFGVH